MNLFTKQKQSHRRRKQTYGYQRGKVGGRDKSGTWGKHMNTTIYNIDKQQRSTVQHRELYSVFWEYLYQKRI